MAEELKVKVSADSSGFASEMRKVESMAAKTSNALVSNIGGGLKSFLLGAFSVGAITAGIKSIDEFVEKMLGMSEATGMSTDALQKWLYVAGQSNVKSETAEKSLEKLALTFAQAAQGNDEAAAKFEKYGISIYTASGNLKDMEAISMDVMNAIAGATSQTEKNAIAFDLLGKSGAKVIAMAESMSNGMGANAPLISTEALASVDALSDSWARFTTAFRSESTMLAAAVGGLVAKFGELATALKISNAEGLVASSVFSTLKANLASLALPQWLLTMLMGKLGIKGAEQGGDEPDISFTGPKPASRAALERFELAKDALGKAIATPEEKFGSLANELEEATAALGKMAKGTEEYVNQQTKILGIEKEMFEAGKVFNKIDLDEAKVKKADKEKPYELGSIGLGSVGGYGQGMAGIVTDSVNRQMLTEAQKTARNTAEIARKIAQPANDAWQ